MMLRIMWCRKALASNSKRQYAPGSQSSVAQVLDVHQRLDGAFDLAHRRLRRRR